MVDSNIYRERVLPSEKAFAYKMKMDDIKHQGKSLGTKYPKLRSSEVMAQNNSDGEKTIRNYIRLTYLIPELLKLVDETVLKTNKNGLTMGIKPAVIVILFRVCRTKIGIRSYWVLFGNTKSCSSN